MIVGTHYGDTEYNIQVYDGNTFAYLHGKDYTDSGERDYVGTITYRKGWYEAAIGGGFKKVHLYNTKSNITLKTFNTSSHISRLAYRPDGNRLAAAGDDVYIFWTDHQNGTRRLLRTLREHAGRVIAVAWSPDGGTLATGGIDGTVRLWNPNSGVNYAVLRGHTEAIASAAFSPDGTTLVSGSADETIRFWDVNTQRPLRTINLDGPSTKDVGYDLRFHPSKQMLAVAPGHSAVHIYNPTTGQQRQRLAGYAKDIAFHPNGQFMAVALPYSNAPGVRIYKLVTANRLDVNKDGRVNTIDLMEVARNYGQTGTNNADVNNDKRVDVKDFIGRCEGSKPRFCRTYPWRAAT